MAQREFDLIIFGASGFTGARVLRYLCTVPSHGRKVAIAGRSKTKLTETVDTFGSADGAIAIIDEVDCSKPASLLAVACRTQMLINCVGPYRHYGEPVVQACIATGTDYLDVCGEPEFMERMQLKYDAPAREAGCLVASAVGFDCVPADVGAAQAVQAMASRGLTPHTVDSYLLLDWGSAGACGHFATFESAVYGFQSIGSLQQVRKAARQAGLNPAVNIDGPKPRKPQPCTWSDHVKGWALPFPGADASVVRRTMSARSSAGLPVAHYLASFVIRSRVNLLLFMACGTLLQWLARSAAGAAALLRCPGLFTLGSFSDAGPTQEQLEGTSFRMRHYGYALDPATQAPFKSPSVTVTIAGPEPGYVATPIVLVEAALELLGSRADICTALGASGGVVTPGQLLLMHGDSYVKRLQATGLSITCEEHA